MVNKLNIFTKKKKGIGKFQLLNLFLLNAIMVLRYKNWADMVFWVIRMGVQ